MRSSFSHHALSPEPLCVLRSVHLEPSGDEEVVCASVCMHECLLVFASASGNLLLSMCEPVSVCVCLRVLVWYC